MNEEMHKAIRLLNDHQLSVISKDIQIKNGTIAIMDDVLGDKYTIHENGYVRSIVPAGNYGYLGIHQLASCYQLNPCENIRMQSRWTKAFYRKERILFPGEYVKLAEIVVRVANKRRKKELDK